LPFEDPELFRVSLVLAKGCPMAIMSMESPEVPGGCF
jgi:hypothetical protein